MPRWVHAWQVRRGRAPWWTWFPVLAAVALLLLAPGFVHAQTAGADSVTLTWTAVGDDSLSGTAAQYDLRYSTATITAANFASATRASGVPAPGASGTRESFTVTGLQPSTAYWFAIKAGDDAGNWSGLSNVVVRWDGLDTAPPWAPSGLTVELVGDGMRIRWEPSTAPDLAGYSIYRATHEGGPFNKLNLDLLTTTEYLDDALPSDAASLWYQVTATNMSGNESARSANVEAVLAAQSPALAWLVAPAYPNPSRVGDVVRIPVERAAAGSARLDIVDAAGHLVRRLDLNGLGLGRQEVTWDGRNDAGRPVTPGPYRAWLVAGDLRRSIRVLRVP